MTPINEYDMEERYPGSSIILFYYRAIGAWANPVWIQATIGECPYIAITAPKGKFFSICENPDSNFKDWNNAVYRHVRLDESRDVAMEIRRIEGGFIHVHTK